MAKKAGGTAQWRPYVEKWAPEFGVPVNVAMAVMQQESGGNPRAKSPAGAYGLMQLMPGTARALGVDPKNPLENLRGGLKYLGQQYKQFGTWEQALAAYNAGPGNVRKYKGVPPFRETQRYVANIMKMAGGSYTPSNPARPQRPATIPTAPLAGDTFDNADLYTLDIPDIQPTSAPAIGQTLLNEAEELANMDLYTL